MTCPSCGQEKPKDYPCCIDPRFLIPQPKGEVWRLAEVVFPQPSTKFTAKESGWHDGSGGKWVPVFTEPTHQHTGQEACGICHPDLVPTPDQTKQCEIYSDGLHRYEHQPGTIQHICQCGSQPTSGQDLGEKL